MFNFLKKVKDATASNKRIKKFHLSLLNNGKTNITWKRFKEISALYNYYSDNLIKEDRKSGLLNNKDMSFRTDYLGKIEKDINHFLITNGDATQEEVNHLNLIRSIETLRIIQK